ncbi:MAG: ribosome biogenesis GTPase YlqF [Armatimonadetes bacterium]|nr:ribosome biogenesis GTPase YlqF [Armatimonadota bacterium]
MRESAWFPGHMAKARDAISRTRSVADFFLVVLDARIPHASRKFDLSRLAPLHKCIFCLNRSDLACEDTTDDWLRWFSSQGLVAEKTRAVAGQGLSRLRRLLASRKEEILEKRSAKGRKDRTFSVIVVGMPNVGKSSLLNSLGGVGSAATGRKPGITRGPQWIRTKQGFSILDTPGILTPGRLELDDIWKLHACGILPDEKADPVETASLLWDPANRRASGSSVPDQAGQGDLEGLGKALGFLKRGGSVDIERTAQHFLKEFRAGKLGRLTLEAPEDDL